MDYKNRDITLARIGVTTGWAGFNPKGNVAPGRMDQNLCGRLWSRHDRNAVKISVAKTEGALVRPSREALESLDYRPAAIGEQFGPTWATFVFRLDITVPPCFQGCDVNLLWDSNSEALVMNADGVPRQGLVGGDHHCRRADFPLLSRAGGGETDTLYVEIACNGLFGAGRGGDIEPPEPDRFYKLEECCIAIFDAEAWSLLHDLTCLEGLAKDLPEGPRREQALHIANDVINAIVVQDRSTYAAGRACAAKFFVGTSGPHAPVVHSILHSHIDLAWLWPASATPAKAARTFSTQLRLLEQFPEITYVQSQAQLWSWCKTRYPSLFEEMKVHAKGGRFLPVGGTWVEMDTNLPSGEALIRQFTMGQAWFEKNLGVRCDTMWLPDTFGYACQLPQLMNGCGIKYFLTNKLSWNSWNKFPHSTFVWEGLDGSEVLAHMPPAETYNAQAFPGEVVRSVKDNKDSGVLPRSMMLIGHGDGGGGASPAMLESLTRLRDVGGLGKASPSTVTEFFEEAEKVRARLPRVSGELYFELHRGTFTSQAKTKRLNRECECLLGIVECLSTFAMLLAPSMSVVYTYPSAELKLAWRRVLTNAFHDTLPGTCIKAAYIESYDDYATVFRLCGEMQERALGVLAAWHGEVEPGPPSRKRIRTADGARNVGGDDNLHQSVDDGDAHATSAGALITRCVGARTDEIGKSVPMVVEVPLVCTSVDGGVVQQSVISPGSVLLALTSAPSGLGFLRHPRVVSESEAPDALTPVCVVTCQVQEGTEWMLANSQVQARISSSGRLKSLLLYNKRDRETIELPSKETIAGGYFGEGNSLVIYDDVAMFWDAWDVEVYSSSTEKVELVRPAERVSIVEEGPLRATLLVEYPATRGGSSIRQYVSLNAASSRLDFRTEVDWAESRKMLRVGFKTTVRSPHASFDSQFGYVQRPTHANSSVEAAKFEVVGHKFADLSEYGFGVALLSDSKYGYAVRGSEMRLSLLRSPKSPDDTCDMGRHVFTYALRPHFGCFPCRSVLDEAAALNWPPIVVPLPDSDGSVERQNNDEDDHGWLVRVGGGDGMDSVRISAVKGWDRPGARGDGKSFIVRVYESLGGRGCGCFEVSSRFRVASVALCNMLEEEEEETVAAGVVAGNGRDRQQGEAGGRAPLGASVWVEGNVVWISNFRPFQIRTVRVTVA